MAWMETVLSLQVVEPLFGTAGGQIALMRDTKLVEIVHFRRLIFLDSCGICSTNFDLFLRNYATGTLILHVLFYKKQ